MNCSVQYTQDPLYANLSTPVIGPVNTPFPVLYVNIADLSFGTLYHQISFLINSSFKVIIRGNHSFDIENQENNAIDTEKHSVVLEVYQVGLLGLVLCALTLAVIVYTGLVVFLCKKGKCPCNCGVGDYYFVTQSRSGILLEHLHKVWLP